MEGIKKHDFMCDVVFFNSSQIRRIYFFPWKAGRRKLTRKESFHFLDVLFVDRQTARSSFAQPCPLHDPFLRRLIVSLNNKIYLS